MGLWMKRPINVAIVGLNMNAFNFSKDLQRGGNEKKYNFMGYFSVDEKNGQEFPSGYKYLGGADLITKLVHLHNLGEIYLSLPISAEESVKKILTSLRDTTASVYFLPDLSFTDPINPGVKKIGGHNLLAVYDGPRDAYGIFLKRLVDIFISGLLLLILSPFFTIVIFVICLESKGSPFFNQVRYGLNGKKIKILKFRTMREAENTAVIAATKNDSRVTKIGKYMRKYSIDELPQLADVLFGKMSLVGPRPLAIEHIHEYGALVKGFMVRHKVKPGITGLAQVNGVRGAPEAVIDIQRRFDFDIRYIRTWSNLLDLKIIVITAYQFILGKNCGY